MSFEVVIHAERCKGCGLCIALCPAGIVAESDVLNAAGARPARVRRLEDCRGCRQCAIICPEGAVEIFRLTAPAAATTASAPAKTSKARRTRPSATRRAKTQE